MYLQVYTLYRKREQWFLWNKARRKIGIERCQWAHTNTCKRTKRHTCNHTHPHRRTYTHTYSLFLCFSHTHKQERNYLEMSPDIACHSQRPWSGFAHRTSYSAHTQTHMRSGRGGRGGKKAEGHVGGKRGTRQHLQSPLLIALLPAWSQITGLEMLQSGLYLLANLPTLQIHTSKPPSYHLLVNLQRRKGHRDTVKSNSFPLSFSFFLCLHLFLPLCRSLSLRFGTPTTEFSRTWKGSGRCFFPPIFPLELKLWCASLESQILVHLPSEIIP